MRPARVAAEGISRPPELLLRWRSSPEQAQGCGSTTSNRHPAARSGHDHRGIRTRGTRAGRRGLGAVVLSSRCDVALACGAAGVNLPELDISVAEARSLLDDRLVGKSVHSIESALKAEADDAAT